MFYIGVYAAVSTYQFSGIFNLISSFHAQITGVGSFLCYSFYKMFSYTVDEKVLSSRLYAGIYFVRIAAAPSICIMLTAH
jgi:hypothetical protein